jgi:hypothetical protein
MINNQCTRCYNAPPSPQRESLGGKGGKNGRLVLDQYCPSCFKDIHGWVMTHSTFIPRHKKAKANG